VQGVQAQHQKFELVKIREKFLKSGKNMWNCEEISENIHKIPENLSKLHENMSENGAQPPLI